MSESQPDPMERITSDLLREDADFADIVIEFVDGLKGRLERMEEALRQADFDSLRNAAHQLKGSGGGYGYPILTERAAELELVAKAQSFQQCIDAIEELRSICARITVGP